MKVHYDFNLTASNCRSLNKYMEFESQSGKTEVSEGDSVGLIGNEAPVAEI